MADPVVWQDLPMSQSDATTIGEYIAAQIAAHNADPDAHLETGGSLQSHKAAEIIDALALSIVPDKLYNDPVLFAEKTGGGPLWGNTLQIATLDTQRIFSSIVYTTISGGKWFALNTSGYVASSTDGETWTTAFVAALNGYTYLAFGNGVLVASKQGGTDGHVYTSTDGASWTQRSTGLTESNQKLAFVYDRFFLGIGIINHRDQYMSTDGITWTDAITSASIAVSTPVRATDGSWIMTGTDVNYGYVFQTDDTFSSIDTLEANPDRYYYEISVGNGYYLMHGYDRNSGDDFPLTSKTGVSFTRHAKISDPYPSGVFFGLKQFIFLVDGIGDPALFYSTTLASSTVGTTPVGFVLSGCADNGQRICMIGSQSGTPHILFADLPGAM